MRRAVLGLTLMVTAFSAAILISPPAEGIALNGYFDDDDGHLFESEIDAIAQAGITSGCNPPQNSDYCPDLPVDRGAMAAFLRRALNLPASNTDYFTDDNTSIFEADINAIAEAGITKGCNPPDNTRYCPTRSVDRGAMAAFLRRALNLPASNTDYFTDDNTSIFEADINAIAEAGITKGCNPPDNTLYCTSRVVDRGAMAAFLQRGLGLPNLLQQIPAGDHASMSCTKDGEWCTLTVDLDAGRTYRIEEGLFQKVPASSSELSEFESGDTRVRVTLNGSDVSMSELTTTTSGGVSTRTWRRDLSLSSGTHTLVVRFYWDDVLIRRNTLTIRATN